jgi:preprotein translocase subunit SecG
MSLGDFLLFLLLLVGLLLIVLILLQRGRGGGLAGAFGGLGGQSALGSKAGTIFIVTTVATMVVWIALACLTGWRLRVESVDSHFDSRERVEIVQLA